MRIISPLDTNTSDFSVSDGMPVPLSSRVSHALAEGYVWAGRERDALLAAANDPAVASDPAKLAAHQQRLEAYVKTVAFSASMVNHPIKAIETVVKG